MTWRKFLAIPQLVWYGARAPRDQGRAWDRYWSGIRKTGLGGDVLWDTADAAELEALREKLVAHMDTSLPLVDIGAGSGRQACFFARTFPRVVGFDLSPSAIRHAKEAAKDLPNVDLHVADASVPGVLRRALDGAGDVNVHVRGVFHVLDERGRRALAENIRELVGARGALYLLETNIEGDPLDHLEFQGATLTSMPDPLKRCIEAGIRPPSHFGEEQLLAYFPKSAWEVLESGKTTTLGIPLHAGRELELIPSYYAVLRPTRAPAAA